VKWYAYNARYKETFKNSFISYQPDVFFFFFFFFFFFPLLFSGVAVINKQDISQQIL